MPLRPYTNFTRGHRAGPTQPAVRPKTPPAAVGSKAPSLPAGYKPPAKTIPNTKPRPMTPGESKTYTARKAAAGAATGGSARASSTMAPPKKVPKTLPASDTAPTRKRKR